MPRALAFCPLLLVNLARLVRTRWTSGPQSRRARRDVRHEFHRAPRSGRPVQCGEDDAAALAVLHTAPHRLPRRRDEVRADVAGLLVDGDQGVEGRALVGGENYKSLPGCWHGRDDGIYQGLCNVGALWSPGAAQVLRTTNYPRRATTMALPIDTARLVTVLPATVVAAAAEYGPEVNGQRQRIEGGQGRDKTTGLPIWNVDVVIVSGDGSPAIMARVKVISAEAPDLSGAAPFSPVVLRDLVATPYLPNGARKVETSWKCSGIDVMAPSVSARRSDAA